MEKSNTILEVKGLKKYFPLSKDLLGRPQSFLRAVDDVTFKLDAGKTIGVVGESGCGKTTLGRTILQLYDTTGGKTLYYGHQLEELLPKYFIKNIKNLASYRNIYDRSISELNALVNTNEKYKEVLEKEVSVRNYNELLALVIEDIKTNVEAKKELLKIQKKIEKIINILNESSLHCGALILGDVAKGSELMLKKVNKAHEYLVSKKSDASREKLEELSTQLDKCNEELEDYKKTLPHNELFNELEGNVERGLDLSKLGKEELRRLRTEIQLIFQDPYSSLPPRMTIGEILTEPVKVHGVVPKAKISEHVRHIMKVCGLQPQYYDRYPHEFSGGQRQRICIARALVVNPKLVICDEPVSALDVSIQAQIINLLKELQNNLGLTYMFISHDLSVVKYITDSIIVMYLGNMMEVGGTEDIFQNPLHPYTQALFSAVPVPDPDSKMHRIILKGDIPSPANPPKGCKFHTRCEKCMSVCKFKTPKFIEYDKNHTVACHLYDSEVMANLEKYDQELVEIELAEEKAKQALEEKENKKKEFLNKFKIKK